MAGTAPTRASKPRLNEGPLQKEGQSVGSIARAASPSASMKGPSRRRGNDACEHQPRRRGRASMKGPSRRRGNAHRWTGPSEAPRLNEGPLQKEGQWRLIFRHGFRA